MSTLAFDEIFNTEIVVVDDDEYSLKLLTEILSAVGYTVRPVSSGALALQRIRTNAPALILLDIRMPDMDGYEVCRRLKADAQTCAIPIIFISVLDQPQDKAKGLQMGGVDFISKPFENVEVLARVKTHLALRRAQLELERHAAELEAANTQLSAEINDRKRVESELQHHREHLEELVAERTAELQQEIGERQRAEEELRESEAKYRSLFESIPEGILASGPDGKFVAVNQAAASILGYEKPEDLIGVPGVEVYQDVAQRERMFARFMEQGSIPNTEFRMKKKDGSTVYTMGSGIMHRDPQGNIVRTEGIFMDITDRKRIEEALRTSEGQLHAFLNAIQETAFLIDPQGMVLAANTTAAQRLGATIEAFVGACVYDFMPPEVVQRRKAHAIEVVRTGQPVQFEDHRDGRTFRNIVYPIKDLAGSVQHLVVLAIEITAQKQAETALQAWATFAQMHSAPVLRFDREGQILLANSAAYDIFGYQALHHQTIAEIFPDCPLKTFVESIQNERRVNIEMHIGDQDYQFLVCGVPVLGIGHVYGTNITARKRAEEALRESEERFNLFMQYLPGLAFIRNIEGQMLFVNAYHARIYPLEPQELVGQNFKNFWSAEIIAEFTEQDQRILSARQPLTIEESYPDREGPKHWLTCKFPIFRPDKPPLIGGISLDITERKRAEEQLHQAKEAAEAASQAKSQFLANMSHELRTPLTSMLGYAQLLRQQQNLTDVQQQGVDIMLRNGEYLLTMINDLLDFSKIEAGKMILVSQPFAFRVLLQSITASIQVQARARGLTFLCEYAVDLPGVVSGNEAHLREILLNLLSNAIKFTEHGCVTLRVLNLGSDISSLISQIRFEVEDTGIGIPADQLEAIFDPFYQVTDGGSKPRGTGLGLPISRQLARLIQSEIQVRSVVEQGSVFWFDLALPVVEADQVAALVTEADQTATLLLSPEPEITTIEPPPIAEISALYELARIGNIMGLRNRLTQLGISDPRWRPFVNKLKVLARDVKLQDIRAWLEQYFQEEER